MGKHVVIVESPSKAKTINKYLGAEYEVIASFGHVRDLPSKDGSVLPDQEFSMKWEVDGRGKKQLDLIAKACKTADELYLATDPDREGEAISWHIYDELSQRKLTNDLPVHRVVFHEITKGAVKRAFTQPRVLDQALIDAYLARRALDYLVGFNLSPILWRKLPGARSAGRVQSVALRLICERESEIEAFKSQEYWTVLADLTNQEGTPYQASLTHLNGKKLDKFSLKTEAMAMEAMEQVKVAELLIKQVEKKETSRNPAPPFTTSTLQQEASRKCYFSASRTMQLAQKLYEGFEIGGETVGLITYMRTDSVQMSNDAIAEARTYIHSIYGDAYLPEQARRYKSKARNAQEAHEAIRPVDLSKTPDSLSRILDSDLLKLYTLIFQRTLASQMASAKFDQVIAILEGGSVGLRASGQSLKFDGFLKLYQEDQDEKEDKDDEDGAKAILPPLKEGEPATLKKVTPNQHFTQPPPRFSEASLVKKLEELGIGRPSTYASILKLLQDRDYVTLDKRRFIPEERGRLVTAFLTGFFGDYVDYEFTAQMETDLDRVSNGELEWRQLMFSFWQAFIERVNHSTTLNFEQVREVLDDALGALYFPKDEAGSDKIARTCPACKDGRLSLNYGKYGIYITCSNYPDCIYKRSKPVNLGEDGDTDHLTEYPIHLGEDPITAAAISLREGPYGLYIQREIISEQKTKKSAKDKPQRVSLPKFLNPHQITLEIALQLLALPRDIGAHPDTGEMIQVGLGRYGPYLKHQGKFTSLPDPEELLSIGLNRAVMVMAEGGGKGAGRGGAKQATPAIQIGEHPLGGMIGRGSGRFGPYVKWGKLYASIPKSIDPEAISLDEAVELVNAKAERSAGSSKKKPPAKKRKRAS